MKKYEVIAVYNYFEVLEVVHDVDDYLIIRDSITGDVIECVINYNDVVPVVTIYNEVVALDEFLRVNI